MEPILLYGFPLGSATGLIAAFEWFGQPYRLCRVDMLKDMKTDAYKRLNGRCETPVLITPEGRVVTETMAIASWLEVRDTERRISFAAGSAQSDRMHQLMGFINSSFTGAFSPLWSALEMDPPNPQMQAVLRAYGRKEVEHRHAQLEAMIGDAQYLVGDRPTLADALFVGVGRWLDFHEMFDARSFPRVFALRQRIEADPGFNFAVALERGEEPAGTGAMRGHLPLREVLATAREGGAVAAA